MKKIYGVLLIPLALSGFAMLSLRKNFPRKDKPIPGRRKIACIGDSITFGAGVVNKRDELAWPYVLGRELGERWQVLNYGISGATALREAKVSFKKFHDFIDTAVTVEPEIYLMMLGTNDAKTYNWRAEDFARDYQYMIDRMAEGSPKAKIVLMTPATAYPDPRSGDGRTGYDIDRDTVHNETAPLVRKIAQERGLALIDIHDFTAEHPEWFPDGVHPNAEGNRQMAEYIYRQLLPLLAEKA